MKHSRRYITFIIILAVLAVFRFVNFSTLGAEVESFRGASIDNVDFSPVIAAQVNSGEITLSVAGRSYSSSKDGIYMNERMQLMVPIYVIRDGMDCSAHIYDDSYLKVQKRETSITLIEDEYSCLIDEEEEVALKAPLSRHEGVFYAPIYDLAGILDYEFEWNIDEAKSIFVDQDVDQSYLPLSYDLREEGRVSRVEDQGNYGTCWAFGTLTALETSLMPEETPEFAEDHMSLTNGYNIDQHTGGDYTIAMAYLTSWKGPVFSKDDPYGDEKTNESLKSVKHVQEIQIIESGDLNSIKGAIFKYGGVQTSIYTTFNYTGDEDRCYNPDKYTYCYQGAEKPNHDIVLIGWDDAFSADNFAEPPESDGAFICQNSWGEDFGDNGVFYVSYYDSNIAIHNIVYTRVDEVDNYDNIYQADKLGWVGQVGYDMDSIYGANIFTAKKDEILKAASFYATGSNTSYDLYVVTNYENTSSLNATNRIRVGKGTFTNAGYYTVDFDREISLAAGERFAILLYITTPGSTHPMAVEYVADSMSSTANVTDGEGYISVKGSSWNSAEDMTKGNLCIKAFTDNVGD